MYPYTPATTEIKPSPSTFVLVNVLFVTAPWLCENGSTLGADDGISDANVDAVLKIGVVCAFDDVVVELLMFALFEGLLFGVKVILLVFFSLEVHPEVQPVFSSECEND